MEKFPTIMQSLVICRATLTQIDGLPEVGKMGMSVEIRPVCLLAISMTEEERLARMGHSPEDNVYWDHYRNALSALDYQASAYGNCVNQ